MYGIYQILLKHIKNEICRPVTLLLNQCLTNGIFPDKLKIANVVPIHKSDDETMLNNYCPISILPTLSKVFEKVIFNQVHEHFHVNNLYFSNQLGGCPLSGKSSMCMMCLKYRIIQLIVIKNPWVHGLNKIFHQNA